MKKGTKKTIKSFLPQIKLSERAKARLAVARKVLHVSYFVISWILFVVHSTGKIKLPFPLVFFAAFGIGQMLSLAIFSVIKGNYHDGLRRGLDEGSAIAKGTFVPFLQMLQGRVKMLEGLIKKSTQNSLGEVEIPSNSQTLRRFLKQGGEK